MEINCGDEFKSEGRPLRLSPSLGRILMFFIAVCEKVDARHAINIKTHTHKFNSISTLICATELVIGMTRDYHISAPR